ncbi:transketolase [Pseudohoeflea coraliihabitans]|uniref:Transketolase n=1 Tax=Pseudohoeflea coraliihabitans TaxID=2860393 RepID=A0ABS6WKZ0_9HYPH|nr:transketolase [Pseudohoeflea sp. DP4N28-3]MBW3096318.1 transketolase [Pseudohoeflea sp. DP4N28-3]
MVSREKHDRMANAIRFLSMDAVQKAKSGHPGLPMGAADIATVLFSRFLKFDPKKPDWPDRDRFVLSAGHGSMLLYSLLYLTGYDDISIDAIKNFRQLGAPTAGHPEYGHAAGIETTTGPLGQGIGNAVGMAIAERHLAAEFGDELVDHHTYVLAGDGCLMEGISQEAITLAGHLKLNKLILFWDDNGISIDGPVSISDSTDQIGRFAAAGWNTLEIDGHDPEAIASAIETAQASDKPTMIACKTTIGFGAPTKSGTAGAHGSPLGPDEIAATRKALGWEAEPFVVPSEVLDAWRLAGLRNVKCRKAWESRLGEADSDQRVALTRRMTGDLPGGLEAAIVKYKKQLATDRPEVATRKSSQMALEVINAVVPETIGGSADLTGSNNTNTSQTKAITPDDFSGRFIHWGIREHGMAAAMNGMALHGGVIPYSGGFLIFSDYCRPSIRLAALMGIRVIHVLTHDSIGLGEDGPTHQPVEHMAALRAIPNLAMFRPADAVETAECWQLALEMKKRPSGLALTRQNLPTVREEFVEENLSAFGAYDLVSASDAEITIFASGSEVSIALEARQQLEAKGHATRVVSVPSFELFEDQNSEYKAAIVGNSPVKIAIEAGIRQGWDRFIGSDGIFIGMSGFGASGRYEDLFAHFGITAEAAVAAAIERLEDKA